MSNPEREARLRSLKGTRPTADDHLSGDRRALRSQQIVGTHSSAREVVSGALAAPDRDRVQCHQFLPPPVLMDQPPRSVAFVASGRRVWSAAPTTTRLAVRKAPAAAVLVSPGTYVDGSSTSDSHADWTSPQQAPTQERFPEDVPYFTTIQQNLALVREVADLKATVVRHEESLQVADQFRRNSFDQSAEMLRQVAALRSMVQQQHEELTALRSIVVFKVDGKLETPQASMLSAMPQCAAVSREVAELRERQNRQNGGLHEELAQLRGVVQQQGSVISVLQDAQKPEPTSTNKDPSHVAAYEQLVHRSEKLGSPVRSGKAVEARDDEKTTEAPRDDEEVATPKDLFTCEPPHRSRRRTAFPSLRVHALAPRDSSWPTSGHHFRPLASHRLHGHVPADRVPLVCSRGVATADTAARDPDYLRIRVPRRGPVVVQLEPIPRVR